MAKSKIDVRRYQLIMGEDPDEDQTRWEEFYRRQKKTFLWGRDPSRFLVQHKDLFPHSGDALDLGMGEGRNAVYLAQLGLSVVGVDVAGRAIQRAKYLAHEKGVKIRTVQADVTKFNLGLAKYDVVLMTLFLHRPTLKKILNSLKPGGVAIIEQYSPENHKYKPNMPKEYLIGLDELKSIFSEGQILASETIDDGAQNTVGLVVRRP